MGVCISPIYLWHFSFLCPYFSLNLCTDPPSPISLVSYFTFLYFPSLASLHNHITHHSLLFLFLFPLEPSSSPSSPLPFMICSGPTHPFIGLRQPVFFPHKPYILLPFHQNNNNTSINVRKSERKKKVLISRASGSYRLESTVTKMSEKVPLMLTSGASGRVNALLSLRVLRKVMAFLHGVLLLLLVPFRRQKSSRMTSEKEKPSAWLRVPAALVPRRSAAAAAAVGSGEQDDVAARRAMAIRRVDEGVGGGMTAREFSMFATSRGDLLFTQSWNPTSVKTRGLVVLLHGLNEHSGRYDTFAKQLNANGYKVYAMDWIGHGGSDGLHGYVHSLDDAVNDTKEFIEKVLSENPGYPCFLFGHSTGAAIILKAVLDPKIEALVDGMVLTSPVVRVQPSHPIFTVLAPIFSILFPKYQFSAANKPGLPVSRDPDALVAKYSDPLVFTGSIRIRTGHEILRISSFLQQNLRNISIPFLVLHGTFDTVTDPEASQQLYKEASSMDKTIKLYEGFLHDLLFEPEREEIMKDIIDWVNSKLTA